MPTTADVMSFKRLWVSADLVWFCSLWGMRHYGFKPGCCAVFEEQGAGAVVELFAQ